MIAFQTLLKTSLAFSHNRPDSELRASLYRLLKEHHCCDTTAPVKAADINTGGKTGTAQKVVPVYDPKTGELKTRHKVEKDNKGKIIREYDETIMDEEHPRIDAWFLCIAPLERPQLAIAVIVEGGGYGSKSAAPIAAALVLKARDLGYFKGVAQPAAPKAGQGKKPRATTKPT